MQFYKRKNKDIDGRKENMETLIIALGKGG